MSQVFFRVYLDENVDVRVAEILRARGFDALTCGQAGRLGQTDEEQMSFAVAEGWVLLTHNRDHFEKLAQDYAASGKDHCGIIVAVQRPYAAIARRLLIVLDQITSDEMHNLLLYV